MPERPDTRAGIAAASGLSLRCLERAGAIRKYGVPELVALVESGHLKLLPAEWLSRFSHAEQRQLLAKHRPDDLRRIATVVRKQAQAKETGFRALRRIWEQSTAADRAAFRKWIATQGEPDTAGRQLA